jgi:predicted RNA-binding protein (virulence factor B family)
MNIPSMTLKVGKMNRLQVVTDLNFGLYLGVKDQGEILMPRKYVPEGVEVDEFVDVFVYLDSEDRLIATTETPYAMAGELAYLEAVAVSSVGAFMDWGLLKDLLVPFREQKERISEGSSYIVYVYFDTVSQRLVGSTKVYKYIDPKATNYRPGDEVDLIICNDVGIGYNVIVDKKYVGIIYKNEVFQEIEEGQAIRGFIKLVRPDGKIDAELQKSGEGGSRDVLEEIILKQLRESEGFLPVNDRTPPEEIYDTYKVSKRAFKRALGGLYKKRAITIEDDGIRLT